MSSLVLNNISKKYPGGVIAVNNFSLDIKDKEFIILVGPSGCGKSTTLRMIAGLEEISEGELYIGDKQMNDTAPKDRDIAMVFQNYALYPHMSVFDNIAFGLKMRKMPSQDIRRRVEEVAQILDITHLMDRKPKALSGGQRQRVALGRAIVREPKVFLLDEPLSNLDAKLRTQMRAELSKLHKSLQATFVYVTHDQTEAMTMGDRIVVMKGGYIQQVDTPQNIYEKPNNLFVAGFIGSPQMNFIEAKLVGVQDFSLQIEFGKGQKKYEIKLPLRNYRDRAIEYYLGKEIIMGIRPEHINEEKLFSESNWGVVINAYVDLVELMGAETYLYLDAEGTNLIARVSPYTTLKQGETVRIAFDEHKIHLFDKETENTIIF